MKVAILSTALFASGAFVASAATPEQLSSTNQSSNSSMLTFTNSAGRTFSADEFAQNLKSLRNVIEQTMPMVTAITQTYSNSASKGKSWTGKVSDFVSGALDRDGQQSPEQNSSTLNQVVGALRGL